MKRLTKRDISGRAMFGLDGSPLENVNKIPAILDRLAAYEDTGLEPQMISEILDSVSEWYDAHKEGRLVVLPCKVGDTLYEIDLPEYGVIVCKVMWMILKNDVSVQVEVTDGHGLGSGYCFELSDIGKTVFRTREEAEAKLKECGE